MRKIFITSFLILLSVAMISGSAYALTGVCSNCHTMHNSQNGTRMADSDIPYAYLLLASCIGCHTGTTSATNAYGAPIVYHTTAPTGQGAGKTLAGGDFYWVATGTAGRSDTKGHNVNGLAPVETTITNPNAYTPPGWHAGATPGALSDGSINAAGATWSTQLNCAGQYGCHGNHSSATNDGGMLGAHHGNIGLTATQATAPTTVGGSYRFLGGIKGLENSQWNWAETASIHNEYYGVNDATQRNQTYSSYADKTTISYSCAECHGYFHSRIDDTTTGSPWLRHPTDVDLPASGEYNSYNPDNAGVYSVEAPVGRTSVPASSSSTVTPGATTIVTCISCHRAHGSPEPDLLRWTYSGMQAGSGTSDTGCFTCHTAKNAD
jgi:predicted CXXCH cytochrome family protein